MKELASQALVDLGVAV